MIFVFGDGRERGDSLSPSLGKVEGRSGVGEEEASRGRIRDRVETREGGRGKMRVQCTARSASRGIMLPYLPITKPLLRWVPPSMNRTDTLDMP